MAVNKILSEMIKDLKEIFKDNDDVLYREIECRNKDHTKMCLVYIDGMTKKEAVSEYAIDTLLKYFNVDKFEDYSQQEIEKIITKMSIAVAEINVVNELSVAVDNILCGETMLFIDGCSKCIMISSRGWPMRGIEEPVSEALIRGPKDGFNETLKVNIALIRRRIKDPKLKVKFMKVGTKSKTDIALLYMSDRVNKDVLEEVSTRIKNIKIEAVLESSYIEELIEDDTYSPFPQIENTGRPDAAASAIYEGRVVIGIDNSPEVLIVPAIMTVFMQSSEDYYERWTSSLLMRAVRYLALPITVLLPALYVAIITFHPNMLPTELALYVSASGARVPFPAWVETLILELVMELIREAGMRITGPLGSTIGIVGGLVIGQASVQAGLIAPLLVIIVAMTTISSFAIPSYSFATSLRIVRFGFIILSAYMGLFGIALGFCLLIAHLCSLNSMNIPYLTPYSSFIVNKQDMEDTIVRHKITNLVKKPEYLKKKANRRQMN